MSEEKQLTPEQQEELTVQNARAESISLVFMRNHAKEYKATPENGAKILAWIKENRKGEWTVQNLEDCWAAIGPEGTNQLEVNPPPAPPPPPVEEPPTYEWGVLTKKSIAEIPPAQYTAWHYKNAQFRRQVNNVLAGRGQYE